MLKKICVIGCGWVSDFGHGPALQKYVHDNNDWELTACCDTDNDRAEKFRYKYGFKKFYTDYQKMIEDVQPNVVFLNVPEKLIAELSCRIMAMGIPLLIEKPPGTTPSETEEMIKIAQKHDITHQVAFNRRYMPAIKKFHDVIFETCQAGAIQNIEYKLFRVGRKEPNFEDTAIHGIDTVRFLTGSDFQEIKFFYQPFPRLGENVQNIFLNCVMESGVTAQLHFCPVTGVVVERAVVNTLDYSFFLDVPVWDSIDQPGRLTAYSKSEKTIDISGDALLTTSSDFEKYGFYGEDKTFLDAVRDGRKTKPDLENGLQTVKIIDCIRQKKTVL